MAKTKNVADFFPHFANKGRTISILESRYGNDGYAFWFKLLELLCKTDGHFYSCKNAIDMEYLAGYMQTTVEKAEEILFFLASLNKIDATLWQNCKVIWCQTLIDNLKPVYEKRKRDVPKKPIRNQIGQNDSEMKSQESLNVSGQPDTETQEQSEFSVQLGTESIHSRVEKSRGEKNPPISPRWGEPNESNQENGQSESLTVLKMAGMAAGNETREQPSTTSVSKKFDCFWTAYPKKVGKGYAEKIFLKLKPTEALLSVMLKAIEAAKSCTQWQRDGGQYIPNPSTWLSQKRWEDQLSTIETKQSNLHTLTYDLDEFEKSGAFDLF